MKFKDVCDSFSSTYRRVTDKEFKDNKDRLIITWQPHQYFKALVAQIETYLVYIYFTKKVIPNKNLIKAFSIVIKQTGCCQIKTTDGGCSRKTDDKF